MLLVPIVCAVGGPLMALFGRWRRGLIWSGAQAVALAAAAFTVYAIPIMLALALGALADAIVVLRRRRRAPDWLVALLVYAPLAAAALFDTLAIRAFRIPSSGMSPTILIGDHLFATRLGGWGRGDVIVFAGPDDRDRIERVAGVGGDVVAVARGVLSVNGALVPTRELGATTYWDQDESDHAWRERPVEELEEQLDGHTHRIFRAASAEGVDPSLPDFPNAGADGACEDARPTRAYGPRVGTAWPAMTSAPGGCRVPDGTVFVIGDNRDDSNDSRRWGPLPIDRVIGRASQIWLPSAQPAREWSRAGAIE